MLIPKKDIEAIRSLASIEKIVRSYNIDVKRANNHQLVCLCPFHDDHHPSLELDEETNRYRCWACGEHGDVFDFVMQMEDLNFPKSVQRVADLIQYPIDVHEIKQETIDPSLKRIYDLNEEAIQFMHCQLLTKLGQVANAYLAKRKIDEDLANRFLIGYCPSGNELYHYLLSKGYSEAEMLEADLIKVYQYTVNEVFENRITLPIYDEEKHVIGIVGRRINEDDSTPKYINTKKTRLYRKKDSFFGCKNVLQMAQKKERLYLVEGPFDVLAFAKCGYLNCVSLLGLNLSDTQIAILKKYVNEVVLCFDHDEAGKLATIQIGRSLVEAQFDVVSVYYQDHAFKDVDELVLHTGRRGLDLLLSKELDWVEMCMLYYEDLYDFSTRCGKRKYRNKMIAEIESLVDEEEKTYWFHYLAYQMQFHKEDFKKELHQFL